MVDTPAGTILFQPSPYGNVDAIVEQDGRTVYFYLQGKGKFGMRACWVANLQTGPLEFSQADLQSGQAPLLPRTHCVDPKPAELPDADDLEIIWFETGNAAALLHRQEIVAVIPPWSGQDGFHGYAKNCASENMVCWPMPPGPELRSRVESARRTWKRWIDDPPFRSYQPAALKALEQRFGVVEQYFSIDGGNFPPRGLAQILDPTGARFLATVGMALCPQPEPPDDNLPANYRAHIELALQVDAGQSDEMIQQLVGRISSIASIPWHHFSWLGAGHSCDFLAGDPDRGLAVFEADRPVETAGTPWSLPAISVDDAGLSRSVFPELLWVVPRPGKSV
jgi:hypothetical protein